MAEKFEKIPEQEAVKDSFGKNILVSASAGSGKTTVMISKIVKMITERGANVNDFLVLTFTKAAASEMKQRLILQLQEKAITNSKLISQMEEVELADICTFDSFCQKMVKKYFYVVGVDPSFELLENSEAEELKEKALSNAISAFKISSPENMSTLLNVYSSNRTDKNLKELVKKIYNFQTSVLNFDEFVENSKKLFDGEENCKASNMIYQNIMNKILHIEKSFIQQMNHCQQMGYADYVVFLNNELSKMQPYLKAKNLQELIAIKDEYQTDRICEQDKNDENNYRAKIQKTKTKLKKEIDDLSIFGDEKDYINSINFCKQITFALFDLTKLFIQKYNAIKAKKNLFDYNDIERLLIELLNKPEIREEIKNSYKYIFVDEYQDTNLIQETIVRQIAKENNLFYVGDLKQAIYGFRNSNPKIFIKTQSEFEQNKYQSENHKLNCNFRSNGNILDFCNKIFSVLMTEKTSNIDYFSTAKFVSKAQYLQSTEKPVSLNIILNSGEKQEKNNEKINIYSVQNHDYVSSEEKDAYLEARFVAEKITTMLQQEIYDAKEKKFRKTEYKDFSILLRKRGEFASVFVKELSRLNIPVVVNTSTPLEETYDAGVLINLMKTSQNRNNDISLTSIMLSPLFDFSTQELSKIRLAGEYEYFYECVHNYSQNDEIKQKIQSMYECLNKFEYNCKFKGLVFALNEIVVATNYIIKINWQHGGEMRKQNVQNFINSFAGSKFEYDLCSYIQFTSSNIRENSASQLPEQDNTVNITTMHSSKGLEYPIVFLCNLGDNFNKNQDKVEIALNEDLGLGIKYYDQQSRIKYSSIFFEAIKQENKKDELSEKLRLLYVACTRAKNNLILVGTTKSLDFDKIEEDNDVLSSSSYLSQIVGCLSPKDLEKIADKNQNFNLFENENFECKVIVSEKNEIKENPVPVYQFAVDEKKAEYYAKYLLTPYKNKEATMLAQKSSVSGLLKDENHSSICPEPNKLTLSEHLVGVDKSQLGTLYHKIFELADYDCSGLDLEQIINNIKKQNIFDENLFDEINLSNIYSSIQQLKQLTKNMTVLKEQKFIMQVPYSMVENSNIDEKVLVQGICDLVAFDDKNVYLIDYKLSSLNQQALVRKYKKQLKLYSIAIEFALGRKVDKCFILSINEAKIIECFE